MNSDLTLVNVAPPTSYFLSSTDLTNAVIFSRPGVPLYRVTSDTKYIKICDCTTSNRIIAILHCRDLLSDTISFPQQHSNGGTGTQMSVHRWFKRSKTPDGTPTFTVETGYGPYTWKIVSRYRHKVFAEYDLDNPVASCYLHESHPLNKPAFIIQSAGEPIKDDIVVAYIVQRHRLKLENSALDLFVGPR